MKRICLLACLLLPLAINAATYRVNPGRAVTSSNFHSLSELLRTVQLAPGDVVLVAGGVVYSEMLDFANVQGTPEQPVVVRGQGGRAIFDGNEVDSVARGSLVYFPPDSSNIVFENMEVRNVRVGEALNDRGIYVRGTNITIRNAYVHHCPNGIFTSLPASHTVVERSEIAFNGSEGFAHNIYVAGRHTVIRHNYIHDAVRGINVKDRSIAFPDQHWASEILYNRIENANDGGYEMDFSGQGEGEWQAARVVGNLIVKSSSGNPSMVIAVGNDDRRGDFYMAYNTVRSVNQTPLVMAFNGQEMTLFRNRWVGAGSLLVGDGYIYGDGNWLPRGSANYSLSGTIYGVGEVSCPVWVPAIAFPQYEPGRGRVMRTDNGRRPGSAGDADSCGVVW